MASESVTRDSEIPEKVSGLKLGFIERESSFSKRFTMQLIMNK